MENNKKLKREEIFSEVSDKIREVLEKRPLPLKELIKELKKQAIFPESIFKNSNKFYQNYIHSDEVFSLPLTDENKELLLRDFGISWEYDEKTKNPYRSYYISLDSCKKNKKFWNQKRKKYMGKRYGVIKFRNKKEIEIFGHLMFGTPSKWIGVPYDKQYKRILKGEQVSFGKDVIEGVETYFVYSKIDGKWVALELKDEMLHNLKKKVLKKDDKKSMIFQI